VPLFTSGGLGLVILVLVLRIWSCLHHGYLLNCRRVLTQIGIFYVYFFFTLDLCRARKT